MFSLSTVTACCLVLCLLYICMYFVCVCVCVDNSHYKHHWFGWVLGSFSEEHQHEVPHSRGGEWLLFTWALCTHTPMCPQAGTLDTRTKCIRTYVRMYPHIHATPTRSHDRTTNSTPTTLTQQANKPFSLSSRPWLASVDSLQPTCMLVLYLERMP